MMFVSNLVYYLPIAIAILYGSVRGETGDCESFQTKDECCKQTNCTFIQCMEEANQTVSHTGCHMKGWNSTGTCEAETLQELCSNGTTTTVAPATSPSTTPAPASNQCTSLNQTACCPNDNCQYISCNSTDQTKTELHKECSLKNETLDNVCVDGTVKNICDTPTTTAAPPSSNTTVKSTTEAPGPSTPAPGPDACLAFAGNATECCSKTKLNCIYVVCQALDKSPHLGCHVNTTDLSPDCAENTVHNVCLEDSWVPKDNPSSGDEEHGQHFDGASFIGGIVLCMGIVVIIFCGQKVYKARAEKNYHTL